MTKVFIDGSAGTTGLRIHERLANRPELKVITLPDNLRKDPNARRDALFGADIAFLCLPDAAAIEAVALAQGSQVKIIDTSTAHRTNDGWAYGFPELSPEQEKKVAGSKRIAVPGCHASGFIALVYPLIKSGILPADALLTVHSLTGYSGGGKSMIAEYESEHSALLDAPRQYGIAQKHKHLPEMAKICGLEHAPLFSPIVSDFYSGMEVTVPLFASQLNGGCGIEDVKAIYRAAYTTPLLSYVESADEEGFLSAAALSGKDSMQVSVHGNEERILLVARYDNLGKGASGAAVECLNIKLGCDKAKNLEI